MIEDVISELDKAFSRPTVQEHVQNSLSNTRFLDSSIIPDAQRSRSTLARTLERTDDERRLLGYNEIDPYAIPIAIPGSYLNSQVMPLGGIHGEVRPINTLGERREQSHGLSGLAKGVLNAITYGTNSRVKRGYQQLDTGLSIGNNVKSSPSTLAPSMASQNGRPSKRPKVTSIPDSQEVLDIEDDSEVDILSINQGKPAPPAGQRDSYPPSTSGPVATPVLPIHLGRKASGEFHRVEKMMNSSETRRSRRGKSKNHESPDPLSQGQDTTISSANSNNNATFIDLEDDLSAKPIYKGTARPNALPRGHRTQTEKKSPHFQILSRTNNALLNHSHEVTNPSQRRKTQAYEDNSLRHKFVQTDGRRRGSATTSSDELDSGPTIEGYGSVMRLSPQKQSRQQSTLKPETAEAGAWADGESGKSLAKSNIAPTVFTDSKRSQTSTLRRAKPDQASKPPGYQVTSIFMSGLHVEGGNVGIVFDEDMNFDIHQDGYNLTLNRSNFKIRPCKILKIVWAPPSLKLRLETCKSGIDDTRIDIQLCSEKDAAQLVTKLQELSPPCQVTKRDSAFMEKIFAKRLDEPPNAPHLSPYDENQGDIKLAAERKKKRDEKLLSLSHNPLSRAHLKVTGQNLPKAEGEPKTQTVRVNQALTEESKEESPLNKNLPENMKKESIGDILARVNPKNSEDNPHLTRSKASAKSASIQPKNLGLFSDTFPEELRFSKVHGLGPPWSKPLMYPKIGKKRTTVEWQDLERLDDGQYLNDNLIAFYLRYLEFKLEEDNPELAKKVYFFNTYFFSSLTNTMRIRRGINYDSVRNWTRQTDIFTYDYVVVPICESAHWYVAVICNLPALNRKLETPHNTISESSDDQSLGVSGSINEKSELKISLTPKKRPGLPPPEPVEQNEKPYEQDAQESLSQLKLLDDQSPSRSTAQQHRKIDYKKEELIDDKGNRMSRSDAEAELKELQKEDVEAETHDDLFADEPAVEMTVIEKAALASGSARKGKRKSAPPAKVLDPDQPAIVILDSLGLSHSPTVRVLKDYLHAEANDKRGSMDWEDKQLRGVTAKQIPHQDNFCDCGLFLLGYLEKLVANPREFVSKTLRREYDEKKDWPLLKPSEMRISIRELIQRLHAEQTRERGCQRRESGKKARREYAESTNVPTPSSSRDTLPNTGNAVAAAQQRKWVVSSADHPLVQPPTRRTALESAALIDERGVDTKKVEELPPQAENPTSSMTADVLPSSIAGNETPLVVLGNEPDLASHQSLHDREILSKRRKLRQGSFDLPTEIAASPPRPTLEKGSHNSLASPAVLVPSHLERTSAKDTVSSPPRKSQSIVSISDC